MDMRPWTGINACGLGGKVTQLSEQVSAGTVPTLDEAASLLLAELSERLQVKELRTTNQLPF
jgi:lipoate-protein ligase B